MVTVKVGGSADQGRDGSLPQRVDPLNSKLLLRGRTLESSHSFPSASTPFSPTDKGDVSYSCGSCGYELNLISSNRKTPAKVSEYGRSTNGRNMISFLSIDERRFELAEEVQCMPYFIDSSNWGFSRPITKLLCRNCRARIGHYAKEQSGEIIKYSVKIRALQVKTI